MCPNQMEIGYYDTNTISDYHYKYIVDWGIYSINDNQFKW